MAFFAVLTLVPSTVAVGSALGLSKQLLGEGVWSGRGRGHRGGPHADGPGAGRRGDHAVRARPALPAARRRRARRPAHRLVALQPPVRVHRPALDPPTASRSAARPRAAAAGAGFALVSVLLVAVTVEMMVVGPLGDADAGLPLARPRRRTRSSGRCSAGRSLLRSSSRSSSASTASARTSRHLWRECVPGAVLGAALWISAAAAFPAPAALGLRTRSAWPRRPGGRPHRPVGERRRRHGALGLPGERAILLGGESNALLRARRAARAARLTPRAQLTRFRRRRARRLSPSSRRRPPG